MCSVKFLSIRTEASSIVFCINANTLQHLGPEENFARPSLGGKYSVKTDNGLPVAKRINGGKRIRASSGWAIAKPVCVIGGGRMRRCVGVAYFVDKLPNSLDKSLP